MKLTIVNDNGKREEYMVVEMEDNGINSDGEPEMKASGIKVGSERAEFHHFRFSKWQILSVE